MVCLLDTLIQEDSFQLNCCQVIKIFDPIKNVYPFNFFWLNYHVCKSFRLISTFIQSICFQLWLYLCFFQGFSFTLGWKRVGISHCNSVLTPYHDEETLCTQHFLEEENDDGVSIVDYLQHVQSGGLKLSAAENDEAILKCTGSKLNVLTFFPDEWANFQERLKGTDSKEFAKEICKWASYRLPTLARTGTIVPKNLCLLTSLCHGDLFEWNLPMILVRGMAYYGKALELQAFLDMASENGDY